MQKISIPGALVGFLLLAFLVPLLINPVITSSVFVRTLGAVGDAKDHKIITILGLLSFLAPPAVILGDALVEGFFRLLARVLRFDTDHHLRQAQEALSTELRDRIEAAARAGNTTLQAWHGHLEVTLSEGFWIKLGADQPRTSIYDINGVTPITTDDILKLPVLTSVPSFQRTLVTRRLLLSTWVSQAPRYTAHTILQRRVQQRAANPTQTTFLHTFAAA